MYLLIYNILININLKKKLNQLNHGKVGIFSLFWVYSHIFI